MKIYFILADPTLLQSCDKEECSAYGMPIPFMPPETTTAMHRRFESEQFVCLIQPPTAKHR